jgi:uncharacterized membrane protein
MRTVPVNCALLLLLALFLFSISALADTLPRSFNFTTINFPGLSFTQALGINDRGEIVGALSTSGFTYYAGAYSSFEVPGSSGHTGAIGVNNEGRIVGEYDTTTAGPIGFLYNAGSFESISPPKASSSTASGINDLGLIVGQYTNDLTNQGNEQGFEYNGSVYTTVDFPGASGTGVRGVNDLGQMVGYFYLNDNNLITYSFLLSGEHFIELDLPECASSAAFGINNEDDIVGTCRNAAGTEGYLDHNGDLTFFNFLGSNTEAFGVNDRRQIVGFSFTSSDTAIGFLATPVSEPSPLGLMVSGLIVMGVCRWRWPSIFWLNSSAWRWVGSAVWAISRVSFSRSAMKAAYSCIAALAREA